MACTCAPALIQLRDEVNARWPKRDKASDGCCGDAAHAGRKSDHNPDANGYAHALDIDENLDATTNDLGFLIPVLLADTRAKYVIYWPMTEKASRIWYPDGTSNIYTGLNDHSHHLHLSIKGTATFETRSWLSSLGKPPTPPKEDDMPQPLTFIVEGKPDAAGKLQPTGPVYLAKLGGPAVQVDSFKAARNRAILEGVKILPPDGGGTPLNDTHGASEPVQVVGRADLAMFGL